MTQFIIYHLSGYQAFSFPRPGAVIQINPTSTHRQALYMKLCVHSFYVLGIHSGSSEIQWHGRQNGLGVPRGVHGQHLLGSSTCMLSHVLMQTSMPALVHFPSMPAHNQRCLWCLYILVRPVPCNTACNYNNGG